MKLDNNNKEILNSQNSGKYVNFNKGNVLKRSGFMLKPGLNLKKFQSQESKELSLDNENNYNNNLPKIS